MWQVKVVGDSLKMLLPFQSRLRAVKRRLSPYAAEPKKLELTIRQGLAQIALLRAHGARLDGTVVEIGSGWFPTLPLLFLAAGAQRVVMTDIERLMDEHTIRQAEAAVLAHRDRIAQALDLPPAEVEWRVGRTERLDYRVPCRIEDLPTRTADLVVSRAVLEHVPPAGVQAILQATRRVLTPGGMTCHTIDNSDHFEHRDKSISRVNFLRYDEALWRLTGINPQTYTNRLRHSDYLAMIEAQGLRVLAARGEPDPTTLDALAGLTLAPAFRGRPPEDLAILESLVLAAPRLAH